MEHELGSVSGQSDAGEGNREALPNVLLVDDQPSARKLVRKMLLDLKCFRTIEDAEDGEAAWRKISKRLTKQFDVVITDLHMPKLDGMGLISRCRKSVFAKDIPFMVITGDTKPDILAALGELGVRDCLVKPFSFQLFKDRVNMVLQRLRDPIEKSYMEMTYLIEEGNYDEALARFNDLNEHEAVKPKWLNLRGEILMGMGNLVEARDCVERALMFCETYLTALCNHAELEERSGNLAGAVESLEKADTISPLMVDRKIKLSDLLFQTNREEEGKKMLCKAATITGDQDTKVKIAGILSEKGYDKDADKIYRRLMLLRDTNVETYNRIAITLRKQNKYIEAEKCYMAALKFYPGNAVIHYNLGILYIYELKRAKACEFFKKSLACDPNFQDALDMFSYYCTRSADGTPVSKPVPKEASTTKP